MSSLRFADLKGLATVGFHTPELDEVFVDVSLVHRPPHQVSADMLAQHPAILDERHSIGDFLDREQPTILAVVGAPGSGKTTLLRHTARVACRSHRKRRRTVPILLYLRDHAEAIVSEADTQLPALVRSTLGRHASTEPPGWFEQRLADGDCVVLLDGLDEVSGRADRRAVADWVERTMHQYPRNDFVITSRPHGYQTAGVDGAVVVQAQPFTYEQVTRFVRGWYRAVEKHAEDTGTGHRSAEDAADDLLRRLHSAPGLNDLTVNPLLLTMVANVHRYRGALPGSRADLYSEICQVMLWRRQESKKLASEMSGEQKEVLLRSLAYAMMRRRVRDLPHDQVVKEFKAAMRRMSTTMSAAAFLAEACSYGLLIERENELYSFAHLTFQESLAANHIRAKRLVDLLVESVDDPWWRETTLLYCAVSDADPIVQACLEAGTVTALSLASDCLEQSSDLAPELRQVFAELVDSGSSDERRRRVAMAVKVTRHLRDTVRTGNGGRICTQPISAEVYELYLNDTGALAPDGTDATGSQAVTGVRASDAEAFVRWVNDLLVVPAYRLPSAAELEDPQVQRILGDTSLRPWTRPVAEQPELWLPANADHPNLINTSTLLHHLAEVDLPVLAALLTRLMAVRVCLTLRNVTAYMGPHSSDFINRNGRVARCRDVAERLAVYNVGPLTGGIAHDLALRQFVDLDVAPLRADLKEFESLIRTAARHDDFELAYRMDVDTSPDREGRRKAADDLEASRSAARDFAQRLAPGFIDRGAEEHTLARILDRALLSTNQRWQDDTLRMLVNAHDEPFERVVRFDDLTARVWQGKTALLAAFAPDWLRQTMTRLEDNAAQAFDRREPLVAGQATSIRIAALLLAEEARTHCDAEVADTFRDLAAAVTVLERRSSGRAPATEAIVLGTP